jgi:hypothetical protein
VQEGFDVAFVNPNDATESMMGELALGEPAIQCSLRDSEPSGDFTSREEGGKRRWGAV